ncbi:ATP-binding protein [Paractinoplanes deccanensis]|uniref:ATP-binding protein n=1 Tax=Paractinoplanes deccanensis TaxID=113561 RepID=UPI0031DF05C3
MPVEPQPPRPHGPRTAAELVAALRRLRAWSGLTLRDLEARAATAGNVLPRSTAAAMLNRATLPRRELVVAFVGACGLDASEVAEWTAAHEALAAGTRDPTAAVGMPATIAPAEPEVEDTAAPAGTASERPDGAAPAGTAGERPELAAPAHHRPVPAMLPPGIGDFTGRDGEASAVLSRLTADASRPHDGPALAAISGMGGVGKSVLAVHVAHRAASAFPDGQLWVNLRGADTSALPAAEVLARFLRAFGVPDRVISADPAERAAQYRSLLAGRRVLVVLDNAASAEQIRPLLPGAASCAVLVTSRNRLTDLEGAYRLDLGVFGGEEGIRLLGRIAADGRVGTEPSTAAEIVRLCGDLPLAIRIAGARLAARPALGLEHLAAALGDERRRLDRLTMGDLAVRTSLAFSYRALDAGAQRLFRLLGLFAASDLPDWLPAVVLEASQEEAEAHVEALVDAQLLKVTANGAAGCRYRFHDLVRVFAAERAEAEDSPRDRDQALRHGLGGWLAVAERMAADIPGPCYARIAGPAPRPPIAGWAGWGVDPEEWFDAELAALLSAVRQACRLRLDDLAFDLAGCLEKYFDLRGMYADWAALNTEVMEVCRSSGNLLGEAVMLRGLIDVSTWIDQDSGGSAMARQHADASRLLEMFTALGHLPGRSDASVMCAWSLTAEGAHAQAVGMAEQARELAQKSAHVGGEARARLALAVATFEQGQFDIAVAHTRAALERARVLGNARWEATALQFAGIGLREMGDLATSHEMLDRSLAISRHYRDTYTEVLTLLALARLHLRRGDPAARSTAELALALSREYRMGHHLAEALQVLGEIEFAAGNRDRAITLLEESVRRWRQRGWYSLQAAALVSLGHAYTGVDPAAARRAFAEADAISGQSISAAKASTMNVP